MLKATPLRRLGRTVTGPIEYAADLAVMAYFAVRAGLVDQSRGWREVVRVVSAQIHFTGVQALPLIAILAIASGAMVTLQSVGSLGQLASVAGPGRVLVVLVLRELAPLLTALVVIARSGTAVASELGNMRVNREIEALEAMGIHPLGYVVFPRLVGGVVSVVCLAVFFAAAAVFTGFVLTASLQASALAYYVESLAGAIAPLDFVIFLMKTALEGLIVFGICCHQGLTVARAPHEVPQVTTRAVVRAIIWVVVLNASITIWGLM